MRTRIGSAVVVVLALGNGAAGAQAAPSTAVIAPTENLVTDGLPAIPAALAGDVRRYTESRGAGIADWHPQRRELLISTRFGNTNQLHLVRLPGGARTQLTFFDEPVNGGSFDPQGRYLVFGRDVGGNEFGQLYRLDLTGGRVTLLTDGGRSQNGGVNWSRAGDHIAYGSTRRNGADRDIYVMDPAQPSSDRLVLQVSGGGWGVADWSPDGRQLLVSEYLSITHSRIWLVDVATGQKTQLTSDTASYRGAEFGADGKGFYVSSDRGSEFQQLGYFNLATRALTPLTTDITWDVDGSTSPRTASTSRSRSTRQAYRGSTCSRPPPGATVSWQDCPRASSVRSPGTTTAAIWASPSARRDHRRMRTRWRSSRGR